MLFEIWEGGDDVKVVGKVEGSLVMLGYEKGVVGYYVGVMDMVVDEEEDN